MDTCIKELMTTDIICIAPDTVLTDAIHSMVQNRYSYQLVVENGFPIGIITEQDIVRLMSESFSTKPEQPVLVRNVMSHPVATITETTTLFEALVISAARNIRHLPVVDDSGRLQGLVTLIELTKAHVNLIETQREILEGGTSCKNCELQEANEKLKAISMVDSLMGIGNRRAMEVDLEHTHALTLRYQRSYAVILFDIDYFKNYNDANGHLAGDEALLQVANYLQTCIRKSDRLYRFGGEEILMLLPETPRQGAMILAERIVAGLAALRLPHTSSPFGIITMSCGVACQAHQPNHASWQNVVNQADQGLYAAKHAGRNQAAEGVQP